MMAFGNMVARSVMRLALTSALLLLLLIALVRTVGRWMVPANGA